MAGTLQGDGIRPVEWVIAPGLTDYEAAVAEMEARAARIREGTAAERVWLVEHPPILTAGTSAQQDRDLLVPPRFPVYRTGRGGQITYHGPGQLVVYMMIDFKRLGLGVRELVRHIEQAVIDLLAEFGITGNGDVDAPGVYVDGAKIASLGLRIRNHATYHGLSLNVDMDLTPFSWINPCGYSGLRVTQLRELGVTLDVNAVAERLLPHLRAQLAAH